jgi:hypothetical protein
MKSPVPGRCGRSPHCENVVYIPGNALWFALKVAKQELDLLQFASSFVAQFCAAPKIMRCYSRETAV